MVLYYCPKCNKEFNKIANFKNHLNRKTSCTSLLDYEKYKINNAPEITKASPKITKASPKITKKSMDILEKTHSLTNNSFEKDKVNKIDIHDILLNDINKLTNTNLDVKIDDTTCIYCETTFTRHSSLQRHLKDRCKSKKYSDELEKIKIKFEDVINNNEHLYKEIEELKKQLNNSQIITTNNNNSNNTTNTLNKINNGTINNNNLNVQLVQFVHDLLTF
jgi:hypothetical protein